MDLCAFYRHGVRRFREVKPALPERGVDNITLDHELEFEMLLGVTVRSGVEPLLHSVGLRRSQDNQRVW